MRRWSAVWGAYVLEASDNQPILVEDIADLFADRTPDRRRLLASGDVARLATGDWSID